MFFRFNKVHIESFSFVPGRIELTSDEIEDKLAPLYKKLGVPFGTLEKLSGIKTRYFFEKNEPPSKIATEAAEKAVEQIGFDKAYLEAIYNCSVTRDFFEPATAVLVHNNIGLAETAMAMDITNACVGFSNGMLQLAQLIESGVLKAGIITSGENLTHIMDATFKKLLNNDDIGRKEFLKLLPTFTLGSGAVAAVLCHESIATSTHKLVASAARSATQHQDLCVGNGDFCFCQLEDLDPLMNTDSQELIAAAGKLGNRTWSDLQKFIGWTNEDVDHFFCHQVGKQVNKPVYEVMGVPYEKEQIVYPKYGNLVSAALPSCLFTHADKIQPGQKLLLAGFGSGLNSIFTGLVW